MLSIHLLHPEHYFQLSYHILNNAFKSLTTSWTMLSTLTTSWTVLPHPEQLFQLSYHILNNASNSYHILNNASNSYHIVNTASNFYHILNNASNSNHILNNASNSLSTSWTMLPTLLPHPEQCFQLSYHILNSLTTSWTMFSTLTTSWIVLPVPVLLIGDVPLARIQPLSSSCRWVYPQSPTPLSKLQSMVDTGFGSEQNIDVANSQRFTHRRTR